MKNIALLLLAAACAALAQAQQSSPGQQGDRPRGERRMMGGTVGAITEIKSDSLTVKTVAGNTVTVKLSEKTQYRKPPADAEQQAAQGTVRGEPAKLSDFKVGDTVVVRGENSGGNEVDAEAVMLAPAGGGRFMFRGPGGGGKGMVMGNFDSADLGKKFVIGEVKAINPPQLTIHRPDDQDQTIEADENTSFKKQNESITLLDIKPGDMVMARGELKNGTFVPATLNVLDPRMMRMMQRPQPQETPAKPPQ